MGVQLPESTPSIPLPLQLAASNKSIKIQRQLLFPQLENKFISILLKSPRALCKFIFVFARGIFTVKVISFNGYRILNNI